MQSKASVHMQLEKQMSRQDSQIGAVHCAMQPATDSLIFQWSHAVEAIVDPGVSLHRGFCIL